MPRKKVFKEGVKSVVVFDLDDTLYHEVDFVRSAFTHIDRLLVADYAIPFGTAFSVMAGAFAAGKNAFDALVPHFAEWNVTIENPIEWLLHEYRYHIPQLSLSVSTFNVLSDLYSAEFPLGIITDGRSITQRNKISALGLYEFVPNSNIFISEETGHTKTDPYSFNQFTETYGGDYNYVYVGDNPAKDFFVANKLGWTTICLRDLGKNIHPQNITVPNGYEAKRNIRSITALRGIVNVRSF
ncbi:MAG: HAD family hydrolase [Muribaculaceae bacterium]|jgi:putative hydrolase of the HAD superfamily|nr:HAD family hydrolase [Muribaculaceae bacterium]